MIYKWYDNDPGREWSFSFWGVSDMPYSFTRMRQQLYIEERDLDRCPSPGRLWGPGIDGRGNDYGD